ncbi:MAG: zinc-ribbon domain-containing protein [Ruminococcaceae bacterium]|nr:zinc-ribbon domain-containing protein [Oscillospiraceae bacterium]
MNCNVCGSEISETTKFCKNCGSKVTQKSQRSNGLYCKKCGKSLKENAVFCVGCGEKVVKEQEVEKTVENTEVKVPVAAPSATPTITPKKPKKKNKGVIVTLIVILCLVVGVCAGVVVYSLMNNNDDSSDDDISTSQGDKKDKKEDKKTEENLDDDEKEAEVKDDLIDIEVIDSMIKKDSNNADISVCVYDVKNDVTYQTDNASSKMSSSALVNIPILYTAAKNMEDDNCSWETEVDFKYRYAGRGTITQEQDGEALELGYLVKQMLGYSDNNATNSLIDYFGRGNINDICSDDSFDSVDIQRYLGESNKNKDNYISAQDATLMLAKMYTSSSDFINKEFLKDYFIITDSISRNGVGKKLPQDITFLNHNAVTDSVYNETAIIISDDAEYIITILCNDGKAESSQKTASYISEYVFDALNQNKDVENE